MPTVKMRDPISGGLVTVWVSEEEYEEIMEGEGDEKDPE